MIPDIPLVPVIIWRHPYHSLMCHRLDMAARTLNRGTLRITRACIISLLRTTAGSFHDVKQELAMVSLLNHVQCVIARRQNSSSRANSLSRSHCSTLIVRCVYSILITLSYKLMKYIWKWYMDLYITCHCAAMVTLKETLRISCCITDNPSSALHMLNGLYLHNTLVILYHPETIFE